MTPLKGYPSAVRLALYLFSVVLACPIRYWPMGRDVDSTWRFALNFAAAHGLLAGRDIVFTYGPLGYLVFPEDMGGNLIAGLTFQTILWAVMAAILFDLFFRAGLRVRNLALFVICFALAVPLFWFNFGGGENLVLAGAFLLIVLYRQRGSGLRYAAALVMIGLLPLLKLTAGMVGFAALAGFAAARMLEQGRKALPLVAATAILPAAVAVALCLASLRSAATFLSYLSGSGELTSGYSAAMSVPGPPLELWAALAAAALLGLLLYWQASLAMARFYALLLAIPLFVSFKHGFVRQDMHVINYFCFAALAAALLALGASLERRKLPCLALFLLIPLTLYFSRVPALGLIPPVAEMAGLGTAHMLANAIPFHELRARLASAPNDYPAAQRLEPEMVALIGNAPVASLSIVYTNLAIAGLNVQLYPVVQRYSAYTPELDGRNAAWIRDRGPRFLVFDGAAIDRRDAWAETPAMWLEVYRWYDTRVLGPRNLLLERRDAPRFGALEGSGRAALSWPGELPVPPLGNSPFWSATCGLTPAGRIAQALFRVPEVRMTVYRADAPPRTVRVIPAVLSAPVPANLPVTLTEFAAVFRGESMPPVERLRFDGPGAGYYTCEAEWWGPAATRP
ncbi:MAG: hypothetical protein ABI759_12585 [Candidatus Solibacter sp.]